MQKSLVENCSQTIMPVDILVNIALIEKPDKKRSYKTNESSFFLENMLYFKVFVDFTEYYTII